MIDDAAKCVVHPIVIKPAPTDDEQPSRPIFDVTELERRYVVDEHSARERVTRMERVGRTDRVKVGTEQVQHERGVARERG